MRRSIRDEIAAFKPYNEQEEKDKVLILDFLDRNPDAFLRSNRLAHMTASAWIVNPARSKVLMVYHRLYDSWSWTGGHADGETDLLAVALREVREETGRELEIDRLGFITEDFFIGDLGRTRGKLIYELGYYFYMKTPPDFEPVCDSFAEGGSRESLVWVDPAEGRKLYPAFFNDELRHPSDVVKHYVTDQRTEQ